MGVNLRCQVNTGNAGHINVNKSNVRLVLRYSLQRLL
jgi:hypothetical protein